MDSPKALRRTLRPALLAFASVIAALAGAATSADRASAGAFAPPICNDTEQWVAPGGSIDLTLFCQIDPAAVASGFTFKRELVPGTAPTKGALQVGLDPLDVPETVSYHSRPDATGSDSFQFRGHLFGPPPANSDEGVSMVPGTATIKFDSTGSRAPKCGDVNATVQEGGTVTVPLNCTGPLGRELKLSIDTPPPVGTLALPTGSTTAVYTATEPFSGDVKFKYSATSDLQHSNPAEGTITVRKKPGTPTPPAKEPICQDSINRISDPTLNDVGAKKNSGANDLLEKAKFDTLESLIKIARKFPELFDHISGSVKLTCGTEGGPLSRKLETDPVVGTVSKLNDASGTAKFDYDWPKMSAAAEKVKIEVFKDEPWPDDLPKSGVLSVIYPYGFDQDLKFSARDAKGRSTAVKTAKVRVLLAPTCATYKSSDPINSPLDFICSKSNGPYTALTNIDRKRPFLTGKEASEPVKCTSARLIKQSTERPYTAWKKLGRAKHRLVASARFVQRGSGELRLSHEMRGEKFRKQKGAHDSFPYGLHLDDFGLVTSRRSPGRQTATVKTRAIKPGTHTVSISKLVRNKHNKWWHTVTIHKFKVRVDNCGAAKVRVRPGKRLSINVYGGGPALKSARIKLPTKIARAVKGKAKSAQGNKLSVSYKRGVVTVKVRKGAKLQTLNASLALNSSRASAAKRKRLTYTANITGSANTVKVSTHTKARRK